VPGGQPAPSARHCQAAATACRSLLLLLLRSTARRRRLHAPLPGLLEVETCTGLLLQAALLVHLSRQRRRRVGEQLQGGGWHGYACVTTVHQWKRNRAGMQPGWPVHSTLCNAICSMWLAAAPLAAYTSLTSSTTTAGQVKRLGEGREAGGLASVAQQTQRLAVSLTAHADSRQGASVVACACERCRLTIMPCTCYASWPLTGQDGREVDAAVGW